MTRNEWKCDSIHVRFIWAWKPVTIFIMAYVTSTFPVWAYQCYRCVFVWGYVLTCLWRQQKFFGMGGESCAVAPPIPLLRIIRPNFSVMSVRHCGCHRVAEKMTSAVWTRCEPAQVRKLSPETTNIKPQRYLFIL